MQKRTLAVLFGGCSGEYEVSLQSAYSVLTHLDRARYQVLPVGITRRGEWLWYHGPLSRIPQDGWAQGDCVPVCLSPDRELHGLLLDGQALTLDAAFPVLHGKNGEDGTVQGLLELAGIPLVGCGTLSSALCMDKDLAHRLAMQEGISVPKSVLLEAPCPENLHSLAENLGYPLFVKPVCSGSSLGITRLDDSTGLARAVAEAFCQDSRVLLEEAIPGFEVGCAVLEDEPLRFGELDEIELSRGFFDFNEKYTLKTSSIHLPARISREMAERVRQTAGRLFRLLRCAGMARIDFFVTPDGALYFNEVNTIPGFTDHSRYPGMFRAAGLSFEELLERLIQLALRRGMS